MGTLSRNGLNGICSMKCRYQTQKQHSYHIYWFLHAHKSTSHHRQLDATHLFSSEASHENVCRISLIWRFYARRLNNKINNVHEKALIIVYFDYKSTFQGLLYKGASVSVHHRNIQTLAMEIYTHIKRGLSPVIMVEVSKVTITVIISCCQDILFIRMIQLW